MQKNVTLHDQYLTSKSPSEISNDALLIDGLRREVVQGDKNQNIFIEHGISLDDSKYPNKEVITKIKNFLEVDKQVDLSSLKLDNFTLQIQDLGQGFFMTRVVVQSEGKNNTYNLQFNIPNSKQGHVNETLSGIVSGNQIRESGDNQKDKDGKREQKLTLTDLSINELKTLLEIPIELSKQSSALEEKISKRSIAELISSHFGKGVVVPETSKELLGLLLKIDQNPETSSGRVLSARIEKIIETFNAETEANKTYNEILKVVDNLGIQFNDSKIKVAYALSNNAVELNYGSITSVDSEEVLRVIRDSNLVTIAEKYKKHWLGNATSTNKEELYDSTLFLSYVSADDSKETIQSESAGIIGKKISELYRDKFHKKEETLVFMTEAFLPQGETWASIDNDKISKKQFLEKSEKIISALGVINKYFNYLPKDSSELNQFILIFNKREEEGGFVSKDTIKILEAFKNNGHIFNIGNIKNHIIGEPLSKTGEIVYILDKIKEYSEDVIYSVEGLNSLKALSEKFFKEADWKFLLDSVTRQIANYPHEDKKDPFGRLLKNGFGSFLDQITQDFPNDMKSFRFGFSDEGRLIEDNSSEFKVRTKGYRDKLIDPNRFQKYITCFEAEGKEPLKKYRELASKDVKIIDDIILENPNLIINLLEKVKLKFPQIEFGNFSDLSMYNLLREVKSTEKGTNKNLKDFVNSVNTILNEPFAMTIHDQVEKLGKKATLKFSDFLAAVEDFKDDPEFTLIKASRETPALLDQALFSTKECLEMNNRSNEKYQVQNILTEIEEIIDKRELLGNPTFQKYLSKYIHIDAPQGLQGEDLPLGLLAFVSLMTVDKVDDFDMTFKKLAELRLSDDIIFKLILGLNSFNQEEFDYLELSKYLDENYLNRDEDELSQSIGELEKVLFREGYKKE